MTDEPTTLEEIKAALDKGEERRKALITELKELDRLLKTNSFSVAGGEIPVPFGRGRRGRPKKNEIMIAGAEGSGRSKRKGRRGKWDDKIIELLRGREDGYGQAEVERQLRMPKGSGYFPLSKLVKAGQLKKAGTKFLIKK